MSSPAFEHSDVVERHHRFSNAAFREQPWDLTHLHSFSITFDPDLGQCFDVVILFDGFDGYYTAFFEITKVRKRPRRVLLHVQSAYRRSELQKRLKNAGKIRLATLVRARYQGRPVHM